jgi:hypothetical protein
MGECAAGPRRRTHIPLSYRHLERWEAVDSANDSGHFVDSDEADERVDRLLAGLNAVINMLDQHGESHWAGWMRSVRTEVQVHDAHGLRRLLQAYGGMGSFNDLVLAHLNGHQIDPTQEITSQRASRRAEVVAVLGDHRPAARARRLTEPPVMPHSGRAGKRAMQHRFLSGACRMGLSPFVVM